jgi:outer membrane protein assembly factor BamA
VRSILSVLLAVAVVTATVWVAVSQLPGEARADQSAPIERVQQIKSVAIDGEDLPLAALRGALHTEVGGFVDDATLESDRRALEQVLAERGYLASVVSSASVTFDPTGAYVMFSVELGPLFHLRRVTVKNTAAATSHVVTLAEGDVASPSRLERARASLAESVPGRIVHLSTSTDRGQAAVDVDLTVR